MSGLGVGPPPCPSPKLGALGLVEVVFVLNFHQDKIIISLIIKNINVMNTIALTSSHIFYIVDYLFFNLFIKFFKQLKVFRVGTMSSMDGSTSSIFHHL